MQTEIAPTQAAAVIAPDSVESQISTRIGELWQAHKQAEASLRETMEELKRSRVSLAYHLGELKSLLSRPGRGGAWSSFLKAYGISRSTGDRLARAHKKTGDIMVSEPTETTLRRYVTALWPKLGQILTTMDAVEKFLNVLREEAENSFDPQEGAD
jgi:hypothetical protein